MPNKQQKDNRQYRIGEFAHRLGVTTEFLKHYEESGLLNVNQRANGYRYYNFDQSARVLEYLRLKNYGLSIKEMGPLLASDAQEAIDKLDQKTEEMRQQIERLNAILEEHQRLRSRIHKALETKTNWEIRDVDPYCFLYHTTAREFIKDDHIYEILSQWTDWLPVTKSAMLVTQSPVPTIDRLHWGLAVPEALLRRYNIPFNDSVRYVTFGKAFVFYFYGIEAGFNMNDIASGNHPAWQTLTSLGFQPQGDALIIRELQLDPQEKSQACIGRVIIPIVSK